MPPPPHPESLRYHYYTFPLLSASAVEGALQTRPGTDYYERNCDPAFSPKSTSSLSGSTVEGFTVTSSALEGSTGFTDTIKQYAAQGNSKIL